MGTIHSIIQSPGYHKFAALWMPRLITHKKREMHSALSLQCLMCCQQQGNVFLYQTVVGDGSWCYNDETESNLTSTTHVLASNCHSSAWNAQRHVVQNDLGNTNWEVLRHPPYGSDWCPSDFHVFVSLKEPLKGYNSILTMK